MRTLGALLLLLFAACSSSKVSIRTDFDAEYDFTSIRTWDWLAPIRTVTPDEPQDYRVASERIRRSIEAELAARGFVQVTEGVTPDVYFTAHAYVERQSRTEVFHDEYIQDTYGYESRDFGSSLGRTEAMTTWYSEGTLAVDVIRATDRELVWTGTANAVVQRGGTPEEREQRIRAAVAKLFRRFPPTG